MTDAQDQADTARIAQADAKRNLNETQALYSSGDASQEALDEATSTYGKAQATMDAAQANVASAQASLQDAQADWKRSTTPMRILYQAQLKRAQAAYENAVLNLNEATIYAPFSGTVVRIPAIVGETISPGDIILSISNLQSSWVVALVEETDYYRIHLGQSVAVRVDAYPGKVFSGKVIDLGEVTQATGSQFPIEEDEYGNFYKVTQRMPVKIEVTDKDGLVLKPGMSASATFQTPQKPS